MITIKKDAYVMQYIIKIDREEIECGARSLDGYFHLISRISELICEEIRRMQ